MLKRNVEQLDKFERENVYSYDVAEIENLFLMEKFVTAFASYKREPCNIEAIKNKVISNGLILLAFITLIGIAAILYGTKKVKDFIK